MSTINEERLCEAVIRRLEAEHGGTREDVIYPEKEHVGPPVEVRFRVEETSFAIEHTLIEPFPEMIRTGQEFEELVRPILDALDGALPKPGSYRLTFPEHPTAGKPRKTHAALRAKIVAWVKESAAAVHAESPARLDRDRLPHGYHGTRETEIDGISLKLERVFHWNENGHGDGRLFPGRFVGDEVETRRVARIAIALDKKLPKLAACHETGDVTVLILEYGDIALSNDVLVAQALQTALAGRDFMPDQIYLAETIIAGHWHLFHTLVEGQFRIVSPYLDLPDDLQLDPEL